jgi:mono/diheme cytochrome c family protein
VRCRRCARGALWIRDAGGREWQLDVGRTGNFLLEEAEAFEPPYTARVVDLATDPPRERAMASEQMDGDCNACHTEGGAGRGSEAPGRIVAP